MPEDKRVLIRKELLERLSLELGIPSENIDLGKILSDALPVFVRYLIEKNERNTFYIGRKLPSGLINLREIDYDKYLGEYILSDKSLQN